MRASATLPRRSTRIAIETLSMESRLTAERSGTGLSPGSRVTSLASPRMVVVQGAYECAAMPRDDGVAGQDHHRSAADLGHLTPPDLPTSGDDGHEAATARRNEARSPHSSDSSSGCSS